MYRIIFSIFLITFILGNKALAQPAIYVNARQDTTTVFSRPGYDADPIRGSWSRKVTKKDSLWVLSLYDKKEVLREQVSFEDPKLEVRKGPYAFYENGNLQQEGSYDRGYKSGTWKTYYPNQKLKEVINYSWDQTLGTYSSYWDNGNLKNEGFYHKGKKRIGTWKLHYKSGKPAYEEEYSITGKLDSGKYFDEDGKETTVKSLFEEARYPGGLDSFYKQLERIVRYPKEQYKNNIQGVVKLTFTIQTDGSIAEVSVKESPDPELSKEAIRVLMKSKPWIPGKEIGEPVEVVYTLPITFSIVK